MTEPTTEARRYRGGRIPSTDAEGPTERGPPLACAAHGCPLPGSVSYGGSFSCSAHIGVGLTSWHAVTQRLREHQWLIDFRAQVVATAKGWREYAAHYCRTDPDLAPAAREQREAYLYRLHGELMWRVGATAKRPVPIVQKAPEHGTRSGGSIADALGVVPEERRAA